MKKSSRREFIKQSSIAALIAAGMGSIAWTGCARADEAAEKLDGTDGAMIPGVKSSAQKEGENALEETAKRVDPKLIVQIKQADKTPVKNQAPYISYYYIEPKVNMHQQAKIEYYVTDYWHKDYVEDDDSERFTVDYWVNGDRTTLKNVRAGDNSITLPKLPKGKVLFAIQCADSKGRESHRLFQEFLIVDPREEEIPKSKIYQADLNKFGVSNNDTNPAATTAGLTAMLQWASDNNYRKVVLPQGIYRLSEKEPVKMATKLTLDMNGSRFKLNPSASDNLEMFHITDCFDSHVINGEFEGDLAQHDYSKNTNPEHVHGVLLGGYAEYCSFENIKVHNIVGYGTITSMTGSKKGYTTKTVAVKDLQAGDIDKRGNLISSTSRATTKGMIDISGFQDGPGYFQMGVYLGYQGNPAGKWQYKAHFYDENEKYVETITGFMYRRVYPPKAAKFVKITTFTADTPTSLKLFDFHQPYNCSFINVQHEDVRCVGMAPSGFTNLLVDGCTFDNCGWAQAKCAFDSEDGWDMMQDLTFRNNVFGAKKKNRFNEFITPDGVDYVVENNVMSPGIYGRTKSTVFRNNKFNGGSFGVGNRNRTLYQRAYNNTFDDLVTFNVESSDLDRIYPFKESTFRGGVFYKVKTDLIPLISCKVGKADIQNWDSFSAEFKKNYLSVKEFDLTKEWKFLDDPSKSRDVTVLKVDDSGWKTIDATKQWQLQGLPKYHDTGWYRKTVNLPAEAVGQATILYFAASDGNAEVFVNGAKVGGHLLGEGFSGWDQPFDFDISKNIVAGDNIIAVKVESKSKDTASGLTGGVHLITGKRTFHE
jgi:hypothetical protein